MTKPDEVEQLIELITRRVLNKLIERLDPTATQQHKELYG